MWVFGMHYNETSKIKTWQEIERTITYLPKYLWTTIYIFSIQQISFLFQSLSSIAPSSSNPSGPRAFETAVCWTLMTSKKSPTNGPNWADPEKTWVSKTSTRWAPGSSYNWVKITPITRVRRTWRTVGHLFSAINPGLFLTGRGPSCSNLLGKVRW